MLLSPVPYEAACLFSIPPQQPLLQHRLSERDHKLLVRPAARSHQTMSSDLPRRKRHPTFYYADGTVTLLVGFRFLNYIGTWMPVTETMTRRFPVSHCAKHCTGYTPVTSQHSRQYSRQCYPYLRVKTSRLQKADPTTIQLSCMGLSRETSTTYYGISLAGEFRTMESRE